MTLFGVRIAASLIVAGLTSAYAQAGGETRKPEKPPIELGDLTCSLGEEVDGETTAGRSQTILCVFLSARQTEELYSGTVYFSGPAVRADENVAFSWIVKGPADRPNTPGTLEQMYTAQTTSEGEGLPSLVGERRSAIVLYPVEPGAAKSIAKPRRVAVIELKLKMTTA